MIKAACDIGIPLDKLISEVVEHEIEASILENSEMDEKIKM